MEHRSTPSSRLGGAIILIVLGIFFLLQQTGVLPDSFNWWAVFILIPGLFTLYEAFNRGDQADRFDSGKAILGIVLTLVGALFLFNIQLDFLPDLPWSVIWPFFLILGGVAILMRRSERPTQSR